jgi:uncharacterized membrane protein
MLIGIVLLLIGLILFYLVNERHSAVYKDHRFWLVLIATAILLASFTVRYYGFF